MKLSINLLKPFSGAVGERKLSIDFTGSTIEDLVKDLVNRYPKLKNEIYNKDEKITDYLSMFVNDKPISVLDGMNTKLQNGDELIFFMPVSGG